MTKLTVVDSYDSYIRIYEVIYSIICINARASVHYTHKHTARNRDIDERPLETDGRDLCQLKQVARIWPGIGDSLQNHSGSTTMLV